VIDTQSGPEMKGARDWFLRAVALLLVALALQSGSFGELTDAKKWYFGSPDHSSAVLPELRKALAKRAEADAALGADDAPGAAPLRSAPVVARTAFTGHAPLAAREVPQPPRLLPDPTGPPRA